MDRFPSAAADVPKSDRLLVVKPSPAPKYPVCCTDILDEQLSADAPPCGGLASPVLEAVFDEYSRSAR